MVLVQLPPSMWKRPSSARSCLITSASRSGPSPGSMRSQIRDWNRGWITGRSFSWTPTDWSRSRYSVTFMIGVREPEHSRITSKYLAGNSFIITPPFSPSAIWVTSGGICLPARSNRDRPLASSYGCIWPISFVSLPCVLITAVMAAVSPREFVQTRRCGRWRCCGACRLLDGVLADDDPLVAAVDEGLDELVGHVGLVGKRHF